MMTTELDRAFAALARIHRRRKGEHPAIARQRALQASVVDAIDRRRREWAERDAAAVAETEGLCVGSGTICHTRRREEATCPSCGGAAYVSAAGIIGPHHPPA